VEVLVSLVSISAWTLAAPVPWLFCGAGSYTPKNSLTAVRCCSVKRFF